MRIASKFPDLLVPPVLQDIFDCNLLLFQGFPFLKASGLMFWEEAPVVCTRRSGEPVYLINLFADLSALFQPCCAVDCDGDVENGSSNGKATELFIERKRLDYNFQGVRRAKLDIQIQRRSSLRLRPERRFPRMNQVGRVK